MALLEPLQFALVYEAVTFTVPALANCVLRRVLFDHHDLATDSTGTVVPSHLVVNLVAGAALNQSGSI